LNRITPSRSQKVTTILKGSQKGKKKKKGRGTPPKGDYVKATLRDRKVKQERGPVRRGAGGRAERGG